MFAMLCHVDIFYSKKLAIFGLIEIWECALNWFTMELVHELKLDIFHLCGLGATYPKHVFSVDPYVLMIPNWSKNLHAIQMQHILNNYCWDF